jgi:hypothetical protein
MPRPDETFIVRVRHQERDAVLEQPRLSRRRQVGDVAQVGALILRWLGPVGRGQTGRLTEQARPAPDAGGPGPRVRGGTR